MTEAEEKIQTPGKEFDALFSKATNYVETNAELLKLKAVKKSADIVSSIVSSIVVGIVFFIFFILLNIGLAYLLGNLLGYAYIGFLILSAFYLIIGLILKANGNKWIKIPTATAFIKSITK